jgi:hypothetical protein
MNKCFICGSDLLDEGSLYTMGYSDREVKIFGHFDSQGSFISESDQKDINLPYEASFQCSICKIEIKFGKVIRWAAELPVEELPLNLNHSSNFIRNIILFRIEHSGYVLDDLQMLVYEMMIREIEMV